MGNCCQEQVGLGAEEVTQVVDLDMGLEMEIERTDG